MTKEGMTTEELVAKIGAIDQILATEQQWTQGCGARDVNGKKVNPMSDDAVQWCLQGAAWKVTGLQLPYSQICMAFYAGMNLPQTFIGEFNDGSTFAEMKAMLAEAKNLAVTKDPWQPYELPEGVKARLR